MKIIKSLKSKIIKPSEKKLLKILDRHYNADYYNFPLGNKRNATKETYLALWEDERKKEYPEVDSFELRHGFKIDVEWFHDLARITQVVKKKSEICYQHGRLLYSVLSEYAVNGKHEYVNILETGTARGFSAVCMAKALYDCRCCGKILTYDILPHDVKMYWNCICDDEGPMAREELLKDYMALVDRYIVFIQGESEMMIDRIKMKRVHFAYLDGCHTYDAVIMEFNSLKSRQKCGDIVFFDDYNQSQYPGVVRAVDMICERYDYEREIFSIGQERKYVVARKKK